MRWWALLLVPACNWAFDIESTRLPPDADPNSPCAALPYDMNRYAVATGPLSWDEARSACAMTYAMDLAVFDEGDSDELAQQATRAGAPFWVGVSRGTAGWEAVDGCHPAEIPSSGKPGDCFVQTSAGVSSETCTATTHGGEPIAGLCETPRPDAACRAIADQRQYMIVGTTDQTSFGAANMCAALGMHIVEINSTDELNLLLAGPAASVANFWVAARSNGTTFTSSTGCPQILRWKANEPSGMTCVRYFGGFETVDCNNTANVICESNT